MASTNKTSHYELSQYVGSDKPTYLTDYNNDMSAIDTGIYNAQTKANDGYTLADSADGKADQALTNAGNAQTDASTALTRIGTMANLTTSEKTTIVGAVNEVDGEIKKFNFTTFTTYSVGDQTHPITNLSNGTVSGSVTLATNSDGSICKLYGNLDVVNATSDGWVRISTPLRPENEFTVNNLGIRYGKDSQYGNIKDIWASRAIFKTNGDVEIVLMASSSYPYSFVQLFPCVIFVKDFGDTDTD